MLLSVHNIINGIINNINDTEQLCHKSDGLLVKTVFSAWGIVQLDPKKWSDLNADDINNGHIQIYIDLWLLLAWTEEADKAKTTQNNHLKIKRSSVEKQKRKKKKIFFFIHDTCDQK